MLKPCIATYYVAYQRDRFVKKGGGLTARLSEAEKFEGPPETLTERVEELGGQLYKIEVHTSPVRVRPLPGELLLAELHRSGLPLLAEELETHYLGADLDSIAFRAHKALQAEKDRKR